MSQSKNHLTLRPLRTPRTAGIAGIIFSVLLSMILVLTWVSVEANSGPYTGLDDAISLAVGLVPFAGIAFLWFMGVVRDRLGHLEDQFFSTIYFGSGLLFLAMLFVWAAIAGTILTGFDLDPDVLIDDRSGYAFGRMLMNEITSVYALRMAGVFMISTGVIWTSTGVMPRWLAIITLVVALGLLVGTGFIVFWWIRLSFPAWVLLVSIYILRTSRRVQIESNVSA